jgi:hypothetical protein
MKVLAMGSSRVERVRGHRPVLATQVSNMRPKDVVMPDQIWPTSVTPSRPDMARYQLKLCAAAAPLLKQSGCVNAISIDIFAKFCNHVILIHATKRQG